MEVAATEVGSCEVAVRSPVCSVCSGRAAEPKYILLGRPRKVRPVEGTQVWVTLWITCLICSICSKKMEKYTVYVYEDRRH